MTRLDRFLSLFAEPWCRFEAALRRAGAGVRDWCDPDRYVTRFPNLTNEDDDQ